MTWQGQQRIQRGVRPLVWLTVCGIVLAGVGVIDLGTTAVAPAEALVGFQINSVDVSPLFEFDNQGTDSLADDTLTAGPAQVALSLMLGGSPILYPEAEFQFDATLAGIELGTLPGSETEVYQLLFDGGFSFIDSESSQSILDATFTDARLLMLEFGNLGTVGFATGLAADAEVDFVLGPAVPGNLVVEGGEQFQFTINSLLSSSGGPVHIGAVPPPDDFQFEDFNFSSSFSGSMAIVPEPASIGLAALALLGLLVCRWRACRMR
jgi:hypothetical protein